MLSTMPPVNQNHPNGSDNKALKKPKNYTRYIALIAILGVASLIELSSVNFDNKNTGSVPMIIASTSPQDLSAIETASFSGSLSHFQDYTNNNDAVRQEREKWMTALNVTCDTAKITRSVIEDVIFSGSKKSPKSGMWIEHMDQSPCDANLARQNVAFTMTQNLNGEPMVRAIPMISGTSLAHPIDQSFAKTHALKASQVLNLDCPTWGVEKARFLGAASNQVEGSWAEEWLIKGCQKSFINVVEFTPNKNFGTQIRVTETQIVNSF